MLFGVDSEGTRIVGGIFNSKSSVRLLPLIFGGLSAATQQRPERTGASAIVTRIDNPCVLAKPMKPGQRAHSATTIPTTNPTTSPSGANRKMTVMPLGPYISESC